MKIKLFVMDVDGTLTDGKIYMSSHGEWIKAFNIKDGYAIKEILPQMNIVPAIITGRQSEIVERRAKELGVIELYQGVSDKLSVIRKVAEENDIKKEEIAYIGDDLNDLPAIEYCGISACPNDAVDVIKKKVDYVCGTNAGDGAVREFVDKLNMIILGNSQI